MNLNDLNFINGHLNIKTISKETGMVLDEFDDDNVITLQGYSEVLNRITLEDDSIDDSIIWTIYLGDDIGNGTIFNPQTAANTLTNLDQSVVYEVPREDMNLNYVTSRSLDLVTVLDGTQILDTLFPDEVDLRYTSATIRFRNERVLSYKRFPIRSLSRLVDVSITWNITFEEIGV